MMKKNLKRILSIVLLSIMIFSNVACQGKTEQNNSPTIKEKPEQTKGIDSDIMTAAEVLGFPLSDKNGNPIEITWFCGLGAAASSVLKNRGEGAVWKYWEELTGIKVKWEHPSQSTLGEAFNLIISSGDYPDIIEYGGWKGYAGGPDAAIADGIIQNITEYVENDCPYVMAYFEKDPLAKYQLTSDGGAIWAFSKIYPDEDPWYGTAIRQDFLDKWDLKMPETIDDWYNVLTTFKKNGVEAPLCFLPDAFTSYGCFIGAYGILRNFYVGEDNKIHYGPIEDRYKDFLTTMNRWYTEGLIDPEFASIDDATRNYKNLNGITGAWTGSVAEQIGTYNTTMKSKNPEYRVVGAPQPKLNDNSGKTRFRQHSNPVRNYFATISTACKYPREICKALDWMFSPEGSFTCTFGFEDQSYILDKNGEPQPTELITNDKDGNPRVNMLCKYAMHFGPFLCDKRESTFISDDENYIAAQKTWLNSANYDGLLPPYNLTADESIQNANTMAEIQTYMDEMYLKFILGLEPLDKYDAYVEKIKQMGIQKALDIQNSAYSRYLERTSN